MHDDQTSKQETQDTVDATMKRWAGKEGNVPALPSGMPYREVRMITHITQPMGRGKGIWASKLTDGSLVTQDTQGKWVYLDNRPLPFNPTAYDEAEQHLVLVRERNTPSEDEIRSFLGSGDPPFTDAQSNARAHQQDQHPVGSVQEANTFRMIWQDDEDTTDSASESALS